MSKPYIVAEVGSNWQSFDDCKNSITQAKLAGANAVKFQLFTFTDLYGFPDEPTDLAKLIDGDSLEEKKLAIRTCSLSPEWLPKLKEKCDQVGIDFMCTAFSPEGYELVNPLVSMHKVASAEATHVRILQKVRSFGKPVILSTGAKGKDDIQGAIKTLRMENDITVDGITFPYVGSLNKKLDVTLLYCIAAYPASEVNLDTIKTLRDQFGVDVGFSDHTIDIFNLPRLAVNQGATVIEKHFTVIPDANTPDNPHSLNPDQFRNMVKSIRGEVTPVIGPVREEKDMILRHNRRIIATKDLNVGDELQEGVNFGIYRSLVDDTRAASPFLIDRFVGKRVRVNVKAGQGLWLEDIDATN